MSRKKNIKKRLLKWIYILLLLFPCFEIALRIVGGKPYENETYKIEITPRNAFIGDDSLGIALNPGQYKIKLNDTIEFITTHTAEGRRIVDENKIDSTSIVSLGCSFTYGYGVNDKENFTSLLQSHFPTHKLMNYGVPGYGTVQSYLQLQQILKSEKIPEVVILNFSSYHLDRNALTPYYRRALKIGFSQSMDFIDFLMDDSRFPYVSDENKKEIKFENWNELYQDWTGRNYFASINYLQTAVDKVITEKMDLQTISVSLIKKMNDLCAKEGCKFV
ncbi:MAG: hypothetical protein ACPGVD_08035, partial [Flavobacteriales bacterium]